MSDAAGAMALAPPPDRTGRARRASLLLVLLVLLAGAVSLATGASEVSAFAALGKLISGGEVTRLERVVMLDIRLPRLAMGIAVGAALAVSGALMQGLFRNPLADPGLVGVSAGAALGAIAAIVLGGLPPPLLAGVFGAYLIPAAAFAGGWGTTMLLYRASTRRGRTSVATMLLAGIAFAALANAGVGVPIYLADDAQLRELNFWTLGSLAGASWAKMAVAGPAILVCLLAATRLGPGLNGLALGEATAAHIGVPVERVKHLAILAVAVTAGAAVAVSGSIGFVGIVVPHLLRLSTGPDHNWLLVNAALLGGAFLVLADVIARIAVAPAELPIGIVTAFLGAPVFLWILLRQRGLLDHCCSARGISR